MIFWVFIFIAFINKGMKKSINHFEHDERFKTFDDEFQKSKSRLGS